MEEDYGWSRWKAFDLLTHVAQTSMGYFGIGTTGVKVAKKYLGKDVYPWHQEGEQRIIVRIKPDKVDAYGL